MMAVNRPYSARLVNQQRSVLYPGNRRTGERCPPSPNYTYLQLNRFVTGIDRHLLHLADQQPQEDIHCVHESPFCDKSPPSI